MCGIFGYAQYDLPLSRKDIIAILTNALHRLEYRGYDSSGYAIDQGTEEERGTPLVIKEKGNIAQLEKYTEEVIAEKGVDMNTIFRNHIGIAHTRWATHGPPSRINSHPHISDSRMQFIVVHNGIITNYKVLKQMLESHGYMFESETDTEAIAKLSLYFYERLQTALSRKPSFQAVMVEVVRQLEGAFACLIKSIHYPGEIVACKRGSPLLVGMVSREDRTLERQFSVKEFAPASQRIGHNTTGARTVSASPMSQFKDLHSGSPAPSDINAFSADAVEEAGTALPAVSAYVFASDPSAVVEHTKNVLILEDGDLVHIRNGEINISHSADKSQGTAVTHRIMEELTMELDQIMKGNFPHFMLKEIYEQTESAANTMRGRVNFEKKTITLGGIQKHVSEIRRCRRLVFIACGTSYNSALATRPIVEELCSIPVNLENASDFLDRESPIFRDDACVFISQSGETADTLSALHFARERGAICIGITNTVGSAIARLTDCGVHLNAGVEIGVASTKAYTSQVLAIVMLALMLSEDRMQSLPHRQRIIEDLNRLPELIGEVLKTDAIMKEIAQGIAHERSLLLLGRGAQFASCVEGALKIKELAYLHSEGLLAGELKHGPLALVDENMPVLIICCHDKCYEKTQMAFAQVRARKAKPIVICNPGDEGAFESAYKVITVPQVDSALQGILTTIPLQLLSYHIAVARGCNVDQPRNLAKSVTVH